jgi:hypothetical protein
MQAVEWIGKDGKGYMAINFIMINKVFDNRKLPFHPSHHSLKKKATPTSVPILPSD